MFSYLPIQLPKTFLKSACNSTRYKAPSLCLEHPTCVFLSSIWISILHMPLEAYYESILGLQCSTQVPRGRSREWIFPQQQGKFLSLHKATMVPPDAVCLVWLCAFFLIISSLSPRWPQLQTSAEQWTQSRSWNQTTVKIFAQLGKCILQTKRYFINTCCTILEKCGYCYMKQNTVVVFLTSSIVRYQEVYTVHCRCEDKAVLKDSSSHCCAIGKVINVLFSSW